jgi:outer membrane protein
MSIAKSILAILLCYTMILPGFGQQMPTTRMLTTDAPTTMVERFTYNYRAHGVRKISFEDSPRLEKLIRAGIIYLSLRDAIALALENNLDLEYARINPKLSEANLLRASAGALLRNVSNNVSSGPSSASLGVTAGSSLGSSSSGGGSSGTGGVLSGLNVQLAGSAIPNLDPTLFVSSQTVHSTSPQTSTFVSGTNFLVTTYHTASYGVQQGFMTGTSVGLSMGNTLGYRQNSPNNDFNPVTNSNLALSVQQNLLQGFRPSVNKRAIIVAKNQRNISDLTFKNQVMSTVNNVASLYWDLVSFNEGLKVKQQTLELNTKLYTDNKRRAELGAIAPIDIIQAEAEMKSSQQDVTTSELQVQQQEMILKNVLTRSGMDDLAIANARIVPTDHFEVPAQEPIRPIQDLIVEAVQNRPDVIQNQIGLEDSRITMRGTKDALLPTLNAFVNMSNNALAGQVNTLPRATTLPNGSPGFVTRGPGDVNGFFLGGYGSVLSQLFGRNFPNYSAGFSLNVPIRNRAAQADLITDELNYRQSEIQDKQLHNNIKLNVVNARMALANARAAYDTSVEARKLEDQTLAGARRKYELGTSTILDVVLIQRDATARQLAETNALNSYIHARLNLDNVLARTLEVYSVDIEEAKTGQVKRQPDLIPAVVQQEAERRLPLNGLRR